MLTNPTLAVIHTTTVTVEPLKALARELMPDYDVVNFVDDSILPQLAQNDGLLTEVAPRIEHYARFAEQLGAECILVACSSIGEVVADLQMQARIPVIRIDEAMAEEAVRRGSRIGIAATLSTTLHPTQRLIQMKAVAADKTVELFPTLISGAFDRLAAGDAAGHDTLVLAALRELAAITDIVVLAQASMARVAVRLSDVEQGKILSSPRLGIERVRQHTSGR